MRSVRSGLPGALITPHKSGDHIIYCLNRIVLKVKGEAVHNGQDHKHKSEPSLASRDERMVTLCQMILLSKLCAMLSLNAKGVGEHRESFIAICWTSNYLISSANNVSLSSLMNTVCVIVSCLYIFLHFFISLVEHYYISGIKNIWVGGTVHPTRKQKVIIFGVIISIVTKMKCKVAL